MNLNNLKPRLSRAQTPAILTAAAMDETGERREVGVAGEYPLTLYVDGCEIVTLMTLGCMPEALAVGWLRNQRALQSVAQIEEVMVDWEVNAAAVYTREGAVLALADKRTITSGCGQGTMFGDLMEEIETAKFIRTQKLTIAGLAHLLSLIRDYDTIYKAAGAVHACALAAFCRDHCTLQIFVEDVGRHNAVDAIAGWMWLNDVGGDDKIFYTTGRLTSEMVIKCAQMQIPYLVSRSGLTRMGLEVAKKTGITMFGRAVNKRYLLFTGAEHFINGK